MFARHCFAAVFAAILAVACGREAAAPRADTRVLPDQWWRSACGDVAPLQVGHGVTPPVLLDRVAPRSRIGGIVIVATVIGTSGKVCDARVVRTFDGELDAVVLEAVRRWRFRPAMLNGTPRAAVYYVTVGN